MASEDADISKAAEVLKNGGVVAFPTETVYGLGAHALDETAVAKIFAIKQRPRFDPLIIHIADLSQLDGLVESLPEPALRLAERFWPGPLTLVLPKKPIVPDLVTAGHPTVAVRMPQHPLALKLLNSCGLPLSAPSANPFGQVSPTRAEHVEEQLGDQVDMIIDGGACAVGVESTIVSFAGDEPQLLRPGGTPKELIEETIGELSIPGEKQAQTASPGRLSRHYATRTPLVFADQAEPAQEGEKRGYLCLQAPASPHNYQAVEVLSSTGNLNEAASRLFAAMRRLDKLQLDLIVADRPPLEGLGRAMHDRLQRATQRHLEIPQEHQA